MSLGDAKEIMSEKKRKFLEYMEDIKKKIDNGEVHTVVIYHANCLDGMGAMWSARQKLGEDGVVYLTGQYGNNLPYVKGCTVYLVDFSYKKPQISELCKEAKEVIVLDHHKTAYNELKDFEADNYKAVWDMERSGAGITWDYFFPRKKKRPVLIDHIEDRDIWRFALEGTKEVNVYLQTLGYDYEKFDQAMKMPIKKIIEIGTSLMVYRDMVINEILKNVEYRDVFGYKNIPVLHNCPYMLVSDALHAIDGGVEFAGAYWDTPTHRSWSLRSRDGSGADVGEIARQNGGGGHKHASGCKVPYTLKEKIINFMRNLFGIL